MSLYLPHDNGFHRLHPLTKLALAGVSMLVGLALPGVVGAYALVLFYVLPLALWAQIAGRLLRTSLPIVLPFAVSVFAIQSIFWQGGTVVYSLGPLSVKSEGLLFAAASTGRILSVITSFLLLTFTVRPDHLMIALGQRGLPPSLTYIVLSTIQIVPRFQTRSQTILEAQQSRGLSLEGNLLLRARGLIPLVAPLVLGSIVDVEQRAIALEARAFKRNGNKSSFLQLVDSAGQGWLRLALGTLIVLTLLGRLLALFAA